jgi:hypothetical protein
MDVLGNNRYPRPMRHRSLATMVFLVLLPTGCTTGRIPNTDVADTSWNRSVIAVCERYRHAVEARDVRTLLAMASPHYFEDAGSPRGEDDYGYEGLQRLLSVWVDEVRMVRYEIRYRRITASRDHPNHVMVDYTFSASYTLRRPAVPVPESPAREANGPSLNIDPVRGGTPLVENDEVWFRRVAENRLELERDGDQWHILSGM